MTQPLCHWPSWNWLTRHIKELVTVAETEAILATLPLNVQSASKKRPMLSPRYEETDQPFDGKSVIAGPFHPERASSSPSQGQGSMLGMGESFLPTEPEAAPIPRSSDLIIRYGIPSSMAPNQNVHFTGKEDRSGPMILGSTGYLYTTPFGNCQPRRMAY